MNKKAILFSTDLLVSMLVFLVVLIFFISVWNIYSERLASNVEAEEIQLLAFQITDLMVRSPGVPENWHINSTNISTIGFKKSHDILSQDKLNTFFSLDYNLTKTLFNINRYEYQFEVRDSNGNLISSTNNSVVNSNTLIAVNRLAQVNNETQEIIFKIWK